MKINLHGHTFRCNHASGTEREYIEEAIRIGMTDFGFSDHTPMPFPGGFTSPSMRMDLSQMDDYTDTILALKKEYKDQINIYFGVEAEYYPDVFEDLIRFLSDYPLEYMLLGQHFLHNQYDGAWCSTETKNPADVKQYVDQVIDGLKTGRFFYVAHPDIINYTGEDKPYLEQMSRLCGYAYDNKIPLEINLLGLADNRNYPNPLFWKLAGETGNDVVMALDAHHVNMIDVPETENKAMEIVKRFNLNLIETPLPKTI